MGALSLLPTNRPTTLLFRFSEQPKPYATTHPTHTPRLIRIRCTDLQHCRRQGIPGDGFVGLWKDRGGYQNLSGERESGYAQFGWSHGVRIVHWGRSGAFFRGYDLESIPWGNFEHETVRRRCSGWVSSRYTDWSYFVSPFPGVPTFPHSEWPLGHGDV